MLAFLKDEVEEKQVELASTPVGTPSECSCGLTAREHILNDLVCLEAMIMVLEHHDPHMWARCVMEGGGEMYVIYAASLNPDIMGFLNEATRIMKILMGQLPGDLEETQSDFAVETPEESTEEHLSSFEAFFNNEGDDLLDQLNSDEEE